MDLGCENIITCTPLPALDLLSYARGFALLHLPKMPEMKSMDTTTFDSHPVASHNIPYREEKREREHQILLAQGGRNVHGIALTGKRVGNHTATNAPVLLALLMLFFRKSKN